MLDILLNPPIVLFYISFIGIILMIVLKVREMRTGKKPWILRLVGRADERVAKIYHKSKTFVSYFNRKSAVALVQWIAYHILSWVRAVYLWIYKKAHAHSPSKKVIDMVRGRGEVSSNNGSSFYLKQISENGESDMTR